MRISDWSSDVCSSDLLEAEGVRVCTGIGYQRIANAVNGIELTCESRSCDGEDCSDTVVTVQTIRAEQVLIAAGRRPNSDGLGLAERGISLAHSGGIIVDDYLETTAPGVYAAGDVTGRDQFVYMAAYGAKLARPEEHTSELQSLMRNSYAVFCLKKK